MTSAELIWFVMGSGVVAYVLTGGADFGGGIWHLLAFGPGASAQRRAVEKAIAPIWEANHVWLIFVVVALFTAFPRAFAVVSVALHIPLTLALFGIVLRGASFVFHSYGLRDRPAAFGWATLFGASSLVTPIFLGDALGALSTGEIRWDGRNVTSGLFAGWVTPFAFGTGLFAACLFALLAAVYLTVDADSEAKEGFRRRGLVLEILSGAVALGVFVLARSEAPLVFATLTRSAATWAVEFGTAIAACSTIAGLVLRRYSLARLAVAVQVALVVLGWGLAMRGAIVLPDVRLADAGARPEVIAALVPALALGAAVLVPSLLYLFRVFKRT